MGEAGVRFTGEIRSALGNFLSDVVTRVRDHRRGEEERSRKGDERGSEVDHRVGSRRPLVGDDELQSWASHLFICTFCLLDVFVDAQPVDSKV